MDTQRVSSMWSRVHVNQTERLNHLDFYSPGFKDDSSWFKYLTTQTPNGKLLVSNSTDRLLSSDHVWLAHVTTSLEKIKKSGKILASGGCLVGGIYSVPVFKENTGLRLHNLGQYILQTEAPIYNTERRNIDVILFSIEREGVSSLPSIGVDYLKLGEVHFQTFSDLKYLLTAEELIWLKGRILSSVKGASVLLNLIVDSEPEKLNDNFSRFYDIYRTAAYSIPFLGYLLFEVLSEFIVFYQTGLEVEKAMSRGDLYCYNYGLINKK